MRVKFTLIPNSSNRALPVNYNYFLTSLIYKFLKNSSKDYSRFLHDTGYRISESKKGFKLFTYSMFLGANAIVKGDTITFGNGVVSWYLSSPVDEFLQHLITGAFAQGQEIKIGISSNGLKSISDLTGSNRFLIERVETLPKPQFKKTMRFTCLSPITVSKVTGLNGVNDLNGPLKCHYLRPWEEGFSDAIKNNLIKKYKLVHGMDVKSHRFKLTIDTEYMNKKTGRIIKNINFKGTNIIGFMAPFIVTGNPELIEIGYETGFGEKGSMGFGMVKQIV